MLRRLVWAAAAGIAIAAGTALPREKVVADDEARASERPTALRSGVEKENFDAEVRPQDDLFRHVNGAWLKKTEIPPDRSSYGSFVRLAEKAEADLRAIIEETVGKKSAENPDVQKIGDLFRSFMDEAKVEALGMKPIEPTLAEIDSIRDKKALIRRIAELQRDGANGLFHLFVDTDAKRSDRYIVSLAQGGLGLPDESYYRDDKFKEIRSAYVEHLAKMFGLAGDPDPKKSAETTMKVETRLAKHHWDRVKSRDDTLTYNKKDRKALEELTPGFDWDAWFEGLGAKGIDETVVAQPSYFEGMAKALEELALEDWKTWLRFRVLSETAPLLSKPFVEEHFDFHGRKLTGAKEIRPRWKRGVSIVQAALGEAAGKLYVEKHFPAEAKRRMRRLVDNLIEAYREDIQALDWMSFETKKKALAKLEKFNPKIGYPETWRDYSKLEIREDDLVGNLRRAARFELNRNLAKLGKPVDKGEWHMTPQTVNAYYNPGMNEIVFPAAILQPPFFDMNAEDAVNYGGIGAVIGHEIGHGFDDQGSKYDGDGNMKNWWTDADRREFDKRAKMLIEQYDGYRPSQAPDLHVNGALTIGENIGDLGGLTIAYKAYRLSLRGKTPPELDGIPGERRFFIGWAQVWCSKYRLPDVKRRLATDPHSPPEFRCNGVVRNLPEFYEAFGVKEGDKLWLPENKRVRIW